MTTPSSHHPTSRRLGAALLAGLMAAASVGAMAQPGPRDDRGGPPGHARGHDDRRGPQKGPGHDNRPGVRHDGRGAGPDHNFYRGERLPSNWRSRQYVVDDWRGHRLSAPPRGYHWVQTGGDYLLVAIATGVIAQVLLGN